MMASWVLGLLLAFSIPISASALPLSDLIAIKSDHNWTTTDLGNWPGDLPFQVPITPSPPWIPPMTLVFFSSGRTGSRRDPRSFDALLDDLMDTLHQKRHTEPGPAYINMTHSNGRNTWLGCKAPGDREASRPIEWINLLAQEFLATLDTQVQSNGFKEFDFRLGGDEGDVADCRLRLAYQEGFLPDPDRLDGVLISYAVDNVS